MPNIPNIVATMGESMLNGKTVYLKISCQVDGGAGVVLALIGIKNNPRNNPKGNMIAPISANLEIR